MSFAKPSLAVDKIVLVIYNLIYAKAGYVAIRVALKTVELRFKNISETYLYIPTTFLQRSLL